MRDASPPRSDGELRHKVLSAAGAELSKGRRYLLGEGTDIPTPESINSLASASTLPKWLAPDLETIDKLVRARPAVYDVWESSPLRWEDEWSHTEEIVDLVFPGDPCAPAWAVGISPPAGAASGAVCSLRCR